MSTVIKKICTQCEGELSLKKFHKKKGGKYGRAAECKVCYGERSKRYVAENLEKNKEYWKNYRVRNREKERVRGIKNHRKLRLETIKNMGGDVLVVKRNL